MSYKITEIVFKINYLKHTIFFTYMSLFPVFFFFFFLKGFVKRNDRVNITLPEGTLNIHSLSRNAVRDVYRI